MYKNYTSINKALSGKFNEPKLKQAFYKSKAIRNWQIAAAKFLNEAYEQTRAIDFKNGVLVVACLSKELAYQIRMLAQRIMAEINKLIGKNVVFGIYTQN